MALQKTIFNVLFRKNSHFVAAIFVSAFVIEIGFDTSFASSWNALNKGRQWKDIRSKYITEE